MPVQFSLPNRDNIKKWTCPHCGREFDAYRQSKHESICPMRPEIKRRLAEALPEVSNREVIIANGRYKTLCTQDPTLPSERILLSTWGKWVEVAHAFGLVTIEEFQQRKGIDSIYPTTVAELLRLSNTLYDGMIGPNHADYIELADLAGGAQDDTTLIKKIDTWGEVLAAVGLKYESRQFYIAARQARQKSELKPETIAELQRLSNVLYDGLIGPNYSDYMELVNLRTDAQHWKALIKSFGGWENVLAAAGLAMESKSFYWRARETRREEIKRLAADPEAALNAPIKPRENLSIPADVARPVPVITAQPTPDKLGMVYRLPKLPDDIAPRIYGHVISQVVELPRETRYQLR